MSTFAQQSQSAISDPVYCRQEQVCKLCPRFMVPSPLPTRQAGVNGHLHQGTMLTQQDTEAISWRLRRVLVPEINHGLRSTSVPRQLPSAAARGRWRQRVSCILEGHCQGVRHWVISIFFFPVPGQMAAVSRLPTFRCEILHPISCTRPSLLSPGSPQKL